VRALAGHRLPNGDLMTLIKRGLEAYERELTKERFALGRKPRRSRGVAPTPPAPSAPSEAELSTPDPSNLDTQSSPNPNSNPSPNPRLRCPAAVARARCSYEMVNSVAMSRRMGGAAARVGALNSTMSTHGRWAARTRLRISDCAAALTISGTHGNTMANLALKQPCSAPGGGVLPARVRAMAERSWAESGPGSKLGSGLGGGAARLTLAEILE